MSAAVRVLAGSGWCGGGACGLDELADGPTGLVLDPSAERESREDDGQMGPDRVAQVVVDGPGLRIRPDDMSTLRVAERMWHQKRAFGVADPAPAVRTL